MNAVIFNLGEVSSHIVRSLGRAEVGLGTAGPAGMLRNGTVGETDSVILVKGRCVLIVIPVLVMDAEKVAQTLHGIGERFHLLPAAGFLAGRQIIRMLVVIARLCPAVQMEIEFLHSELVELLHLLFPYGKRCEGVVFLRGCGIEKLGFRVHAGLDALMDEGSAHETIHGRNPGSLLL